jgi:alginate O-acetyltransferase complex protein AlgJ
MAGALSFVFLLTIFWLPVVDGIERSGDSGSRPVRQTISNLAASLSDLPQRGLVATNRAVKQDLDSLDTALEETSILRRTWVPWVQWRLATSLGIGSEQVYVGTEGWLFFRADVDHVVGRGFLEPSVLDARTQAGDLWSVAPEADPLPAIRRLVERLRDRDIETIVMPTPVKPTVDPEALIAAARFPSRPADVPPRSMPVRNPSTEELLSRLRAAGVEVFDPAPLLVAAKLESGEPQYLRTDTHWTPTALGRVARALVRRLEQTVELSSADVAYRRRPVLVEGWGDLGGMLALPTGQDRIPPERIETQLVLTPAGTIWRPARAAEVLVVGDSFTNVFSDPALGWGGGAGFAEQLAWELGAAVDRIAVNAGGARAAREAFYRALASDPARFAETRVVIYQFATRELSQGDWRVSNFRP